MRHDCQHLWNGMEFLLPFPCTVPYIRVKSFYGYLLSHAIFSATLSTHRLALFNVCRSCRRKSMLNGRLLRSQGVWRVGFNPLQVLLEATAIWEWDSMLSLRLTTVGIVIYHHLCTHPLQTGRGFPLETISLLQISHLQWGSPSPTHLQWEECLFTQTHMTLHPNLSQSQERSSHNVQASRSPLPPVTLTTTLS